MSQDSICKFWGGCTNPATSRKWCEEHRRMSTHGPCQHPDGCTADGGKPAPILSKGLCSTHHARWTTTGDVGIGGLMLEPQVGKTCKHPDGCPFPAYQRGWCQMHIARIRNRDGDVGPVGRLKNANGDGNLDSRGYVRLTVDYRRIQEHRHVMEQMLGRKMKDFETVHHKNGRRADNRPENLELWVKAQPAGQRAVDLAAWVVETYPELIR